MSSVFNKKDTASSTPSGSHSNMHPYVATAITTLQRNILLIIGVVALIIALSITSSTLSAREERLADQRAQISQVEGQVRVKEDDSKEAKRDTVLKATGVDLERKRTDDKLFEDMMSDVLTWRSLPEYEKVRARVMERWDLSEDSQFMSVFMPGEIQGVSRVDPQGNTHYAYDTHLQSKFGGATIYVSNVDAVSGVYSYFAVVRSEHNSDDGNASSIGYSIVTYDISDGEIYNIAALPTFGGVKTSN